MFTLEDIHALILAAKDAPIADLEVEKDGWRVRISRQVARSNSTVAASIPSPGPSPAEVPVETSLAQSTGHIIVSPGYGVFHRSASPDDPPYADVGQNVEKGQQVGIVEAMKVFSAIPSPAAGRIVEILVESGQDVEAGQPLFRLQ